MNTNYFHDFLIRETTLNEAELSLLLSQCQRLVVNKGDVLVKRGDVCFKSYYVEKGLMRYYSIDDKGKEHILQFAPEGWFISDRQSISAEQPTDFFIDALEDSELLILDDAFLLNLSKENESFLALNNRLLHNHIRSLQTRINQLLSYSAEERYLAFIRIYPDILLRVPQSMVSSYLGITPESLSRIRKDLAIRNKL